MKYINKPHFKILLIFLISFLNYQILISQNNDNWDTQFDSLGLNGDVYAIANNGNDVYVGGAFTAAGGNDSIKFIAKWDGTEWSSVGGGLGTGASTRINSIVVYEGNVYVGGHFCTFTDDDVFLDRVAMWDGNSWSSFGINADINGDIYAIAVNETGLYVGGNFTQIAGIYANRIARWYGGNWNALGSGIDNMSVRALAINGGDLYVGGSFTIAGGNNSIKYVAKYNVFWQALGSGVNKSVSTLLMNGDYLYVGGNFTEAGGISINRIAKWDGNNWYSIGTGLGYNGVIETIAIDRSYVFAGGSFNDTDFNKIAKWDGNNWSGLGSGVNSTVYSMDFTGNKVYVGGSFTQAGENPSYHFGCWTIPNSIPVAVFDTVNTNEDMSVTVNVLLNDYDNDNDNLIITQISSPYNGTAMIDSVYNTVIYIPDNDFFGSDSFTYTISDDSGGLDTGTVRILVYPINDAPTISIINDITILEDTGVQNVDFYGVTTGASNEGNQYLNAYVTSSNFNLIKNILITYFSPDTSGVVSFEIYPDSIGFAIITIKLQDDGDTSNNGIDTVLSSFIVNVTAINDPPSIISPDSVYATEDIYFRYIAEGVDVDNHSLIWSFNHLPNWLDENEYSVFGTPREGDGDTTFLLIVFDSEISDSLNVFISVNSINDAPVITSADSVSATEDMYFKYIASASDIEDSSITFSFDDLPCWLSSDADSVYGIPSEGIKDTSFIVIASDGELNDTLTVILAVIPVNDPPVISTIPDTSFNEDEQLKFAISYLYDFVYDPDNADSSLTWSFSDTDYVYVTMDEDSVTLSSQIDWFGKDTLSAKVSDGEFFDEASFVITVHPVNDPPYFTELMPDSISFDSNVSDTLLLTELASDVDNPDSSLSWSYIHSSFVLCHINDTMKTAIFWVEENLSGQDTVVLSVSDGEFTVYDSLIVIVSPVTGIEYLMSQIPNEYSLKQNYPNPFNPTTTIIYGLPKLSHVDIRIYDLLGREVATLVNNNQEAKYYKVIWDAKDRSGNTVPSGMYLYRIVAKSGNRTFVKTRKLLLMR